MYEDYPEMLEKISIQAGEIAADQYLGKNISKYLPIIIENINYINGFMDDVVENDSDMQVYLYALGYNYYRLKDSASNPTL